MSGTQNDDWRLTGQEKYLFGATLRFEAYVPPSDHWEHDHCDFCWGKFTGENVVDGLNVGYTTLDHAHWICETCYADFRELFCFSLALDIGRG